MLDSNPSSSRTARLAWAAVLVPLVYAIMAHRHLYADGVNFFLQSLAHNDFSRWDPPRQNAHFVTQGLQVVLMWLGVTRVDVLSWAYGIGLFGAPCAILLSAGIMVPQAQRKNVVPLLWASYALIALNTSFFIISEANLGMALAVALTLYVMPWADAADDGAAAVLPSAATSVRTRVSKHGPRDLYAVGLAAIATHVYEFFAVWGICIAALAVWRMRQRHHPAARGALAITTGLMLWASGVGLYNILYNTGRTAEDAGVTDIVMALLGAPISALSLVAFVGVCAGWLFAPLRPSPARIAGGTALVSAAMGLCPLWTDAALPVRLHYPGRLLCLGVPLAVALVALWTRGRPQIRAMPGACAALVAGLVAFNATWQLASTWRWQAWRTELQATLATHPGRTPVGATALKEAPFNWAWTFPSQSIVEQAMGAGVVEALIMPDNPGKWQPFDAAQNAALPRLDQFHIGYKLP